MSAQLFVALSVILIPDNANYAAKLNQRLSCFDLVLTNFRFRVAGPKKLDLQVIHLVDILKDQFHSTYLSQCTLRTYLQLVKHAR